MVKIWGEGARTTTQGFYSLNSPEFYTQQSMVKKVPVFHHIGGISQSKKKKIFFKNYFLLPVFAQEIHL